MATAATSLATFDDRPFFDKALRYGVEQEILSPERLRVIEEDLSKGVVQIAGHFGTVHLRPELDLALLRMVRLIGLYLEDTTDGDLQAAAILLRDKTLLSLSKGGADMLRRLHAMPENTVIAQHPVSAEDQRVYLDKGTASSALSCVKYRSELASRREVQDMINFSFWLAGKMGVPRSEIDIADSLIHTAMLVLFVQKAELRLPTRLQFAQLIKAAKPAKAQLDNDRLNAFMRDAPTEFKRLAEREMGRFVETILPRIRAASCTADKLLYDMESLHLFFVKPSLDEDSREYGRLVSKEWDRVTRGEADDPAVIATVFFFVATGFPPKASMLMREAKEVVRVFRESGFDSSAVVAFINEHAPIAFQKSLLDTWKGDLRIDAEHQLSDDPERPDTYMARALEFLRTTCRATWKKRIQ